MKHNLLFFQICGGLLNLKHEKAYQLKELQINVASKMF